MRWLWAGVGFTSLVLGAIGIVLPLWPTTVFWIIAAFCLAESHPKARDWIYTRPGIGPTIQSFIERGEIARAGKIAAVTGIVIAGGISAYLLRGNITWLLVTLIILIAVTAFILTRREPN
jgi:uncharacterized membrane protein YbaN (DUF454 family)